MSEDEKNYKYFYQRGKRLYKENRINECLKALNKAFSIIPSEELQIKINKIEQCVRQDHKDSIHFKANENKLLLENKYYVNATNFNRLFGYQQEGVIWLFKVFEARKGCILADDMGLGKTVQMVFYLRELFESDLIRTALVIMPKSLLINWEREVKSWAPDVNLCTYIDQAKERNLQKIKRKGGILLTSYGTVMHNWDDLNRDPEFKWGVLALDEGHKIKNPSSKTFKTVNALRADSRVIMTGTAVQNNLKELWALFDFTHQGSLLGSYSTFNRQYEKPITNSRKKDATQTEKLYGDQISVSLKNLIRPYFLRRTKEEVNKECDESGNLVPKLCRKNDIVIWLSMTEAQIEFYKKFLEQEGLKIRMLRSEKRSPLLELNILKKICDHPRLLSPDQCSELGLKAAENIDDITIEDLISESGKMVFLEGLVVKMIDDGNKCLIFSQSKKILTIIGRMLNSRNIKFLRLDGSVLKAVDRQNIVDTFNGESKFKILLLTAQVGGVGLTLTGADRVIIYDLNWNPSTDAQAVDRIYRIGQKKNVIIYRFITCGTVEEKIYRRQIFKDSLNRQTTGNAEADDNTYRYFNQSELFELFVFGDPYISNTQIQLTKMHSHQRKTDAYLDDHISWLESQNIFGISDHNLLFSQKDEEIVVDQETKDMLASNMKYAENILAKEAQSKLSVDEVELRTLMSQLTINNYVGKIKEKVPNENMFIPGRSDIKRPIFNQPKKNIFQPIMDNYISINPNVPFIPNSVIYTNDSKSESMNSFSSSKTLEEDNSMDTISLGDRKTDSSSKEEKEFFIVVSDDEELENLDSELDYVDLIDKESDNGGSEIIESSENEDIEESDDDFGVKGKAMKPTHKFRSMRIIDSDEESYNSEETNGCEKESRNPEEVLIGGDRESNQSEEELKDDTEKSHDSEENSIDGDEESNKSEEESHSSEEKLTDDEEGLNGVTEKSHDSEDDLIEDTDESHDSKEKLIDGDEESNKFEEESHSSEEKLTGDEQELNDDTGKSHDFRENLNVEDEESNNPEQELTFDKKESNSKQENENLDTSNISEVHLNVSILELSDLSSKKDLSKNIETTDKDLSLSGSSFHSDDLLDETASFIESD